MGVITKPTLQFGIALSFLKNKNGKSKIPDTSKLSQSVARARARARARAKDRTCGHTRLNCTYDDMDSLQ